MNCCSACSVDPKLLVDVVLEEDVASMLDDGMLAMRKGVEPNNRVVGFKSVVVVKAVVAKAVDPNDLVVD